MTISYKDAGVDTQAGQQFVSRIKNITNSNQNVLSGIGGFAALYQLEHNAWRKPILVSSTDGVGTKIQIALKMQLHRGIGQDLVAMCVNDILCCGAKPLFFLDYMVSGKLNQSILLEVIQGINDGCQLSNMPLIGGETAEHPGEFPDSHYDLAGFTVGIVEKDNILPKNNIVPGDIILGLASSGFHSNGFSLIRRIIANTKTKLDQKIDDLNMSLGEALLIPTHIYFQDLVKIHQVAKIKALAHITGGGWYENIVRVLTSNLMANTNTQSIPDNPLFEIIEKMGPVSKREMYATFNMGIGMIIITSAEEAAKAMADNAHLIPIGEISSRRDGQASIHIAGLD